MTLRIAIGGLNHETNTFVPTSTSLAHFYVKRDAELLGQSGEGLGIGGLLEAANAHGAEIIPLVSAWANPLGVIEASAYATLKDELLQRMEAALPLDIVALDLHGAGVAEGCDDIEGDLTQAVRELVGPHVVLTVTHDLHGNVTQREAQATDTIWCCREYPHDDLRDRGWEAIETAVRQAQGTCMPVQHLEPLPLLMPTTTTYLGVGREINEHLADLETRDGVLDVTLQHGFPYSDTPHTRSAVICITDGDADLARRTAKQAARFIWDRRHALLVEHPMPEEAIALALQIPGRPVVINETSDNAGGAAPADGTHLLRALLAAGVDESVFCGIKDEVVVQQATAAGVGATIDVVLGGRTDPLHGDPLHVSAYVKALTDGQIVLEAPMGRGWKVDHGPTALLVVDGIEIIVISIAFQTIDRTLALAHGIDVTQRRLVALKSSNHFRSGFQELAAGIVTTDPPGWTTHRLDVFPRTRVVRPIFPLDADATLGNDSLSQEIP